MIISGGVNLYPAEIEAGLLRHPAVLDVAVIGIPDDEFGEQVKAFVELKPGASAAPEDIVEHAKQHLAFLQASEIGRDRRRTAAQYHGQAAEAGVERAVLEGKGTTRMSDILDLGGRVAFVTGAGQGA